MPPSLPLVALAVALAAAGTDRVPGETPLPEIPFVESFRGNFTVEEGEVPPGDADGTGAAFLTASSYRFVSRETVAGSDPPLRLRFRLRVYRFADRQSASRALSDLAGDVRESLYFKSPLFAQVSGASLYRLDGECLWPSRSWESVESRLGETVLTGGAAPGNGVPLRVLCGGTVVTSPSPLPPPAP